MITNEVQSFAMLHNKLLRFSTLRNILESWNLLITELKTEEPKSAAGGALYLKAQLHVHHFKSDPEKA